MTVALAGQYDATQGRGELCRLLICSPVHQCDPLLVTSPCVIASVLCPYTLPTMRTDPLLLPATLISMVQISAVNSSAPSLCRVGEGEEHLMQHTLSPAKPS